MRYGEDKEGNIRAEDWEKKKKRPGKTIRIDKSKESSNTFGFGSIEQEEQSSEEHHC